MKNTKQKRAKVLPKIKSNFALENDYKRKLQTFSNEINRSVLYWALARYNKTFDKNVSKQLAFEFDELLRDWGKRADNLAKNLAKKFTRNTEKYVNLKFASFDESFNIKNKTQGVKNQLQAIYERNLALIKTIPSEIIARYRSAFLNSIGSFDQEAIYKQAKTFKGISDRRARTIARDQAHKAISGYTQARAQQLGFEFYRWETAHDERVSKGEGGHKILNGRIYRYDTPTAVIDSYGNKGHCGDRVNCRCVAVSIIPQLNQEFKLIKDDNAGDYYIIVDKK